MKKRVWIVLGFVLASLAMAVFIVVPLALEAAPGKQTTLDVNYSNDLTPAFVASELRLDASVVASVTVIPGGGGCQVTFNLPLRTDIDETFDRQGNVISSRQRQIVTLDERQQSRLDELMETQGCFRARP